MIVKVSEEKNEYGWADRKYGLINSNGELLLEPVYESISSMGDNFYIVRQGSYPDEKKGLLNSKGEFLFDVKFDTITSFNDDGYALIAGDSTWFIIDTEGNVVF